jgi:3-dehydroquinate dehydratase
MGCDYYIEKNLYIYYIDNSINYINLKKDRGYYYEITDDMVDIDFDAPSEQVRQRLKERHLEPVEMPCLIYSNHNFINDNVSNKYKMILEYEMMNHDYKTWDDIKNIVVMEERYERD